MRMYAKTVNFKHTTQFTKSRWCNFRISVFLLDNKYSFRKCRISIGWVVFFFCEKYFIAKWWLLRWIRLASAYYYRVRKRFHAPFNRLMWFSVSIAKKMLSSELLLLSSILELYCLKVTTFKRCNKSGFAYF